MGKTDKVSVVQVAETAAAHVPAAAGIREFISSWLKAFTATELLCVVDTPVFTGNSISVVQKPCSCSDRR
jgi:hypothetical protein